MSDMISFDFTLDNILSVKAPKGTDPDTLHEAVRDKLASSHGDCSASSLTPERFRAPLMPKNWKHILRGH